MEIYQDSNGLIVETLRPIAGTIGDGNHYFMKCGRQYTHSVSFQHGSVDKVGVNGPTSEAMVAVLIHRSGVVDKVEPSQHLKEAIAHLQKAQAALAAHYDTTDSLVA